MVTCVWCEDPSGHLCVTWGFIWSPVTWGSIWSPVTWGSIWSPVCDVRIHMVTCVWREDPYGHLCGTWGSIYSPVCDVRIHMVTCVWREDPYGHLCVTWESIWSPVCVTLVSHYCQGQYHWVGRRVSGGNSQSPPPLGTCGLNIACSKMNDAHFNYCTV